MANLAASFINIIPMNYSRLNTIPTEKNLALVLQGDQTAPSGLLTDHEHDYLQHMRNEHTEQWIEINQYTRRVFVFVLKDQKEAHMRTENMRVAGATLCKKLNTLKETSLAVAGGEFTLAIAEGVALANYQYLRYKTKKDKANTLNELALVDVDEDDLKALQVSIRATQYARDLVNTPVWDLTATQLGESAKEAGEKYGLAVDVFSKKKIESLKMGGLLAVNKGSLDDPAFIVMEHKPANARNEKPLVLVGKGVVYDTGGLSLKPTAYMEDMKCDMGGGATVIATMSAVAEAKLPLHVIGLVPATDNRPGGNAVTPGDVITISDGTTVEVMNTDAEGRLILSDALHYAKKYDPELVIDLATLTGAAARAIGPYGIVAMGTAGEEAWQKLMASGNNTYERIVQFPFWEEYDELLKSPIADLKNIGGPEAGAITAGKFLAHFTDYPYIHLDIAGPAFIKKARGYQTEGATGIGVRLLVNFLRNY
jgi:leucyl aminopeptidase